MFVFDLSHDRMASDPVTMVSDVQQALILEDRRYTEAARKIGLSTREYDEFENHVMIGEVDRTTLPRQLDAMAGLRHGRIYAVKNVRVRAGEAAYVVALADGKRVYVPVVCGNLSVLRATPLRRVTRVVRLPAARPPAARPAAAVPVAAVAAPTVSVPSAAVEMPKLTAPAAIAIPAPNRSLAIPFFAWFAGVISQTVGSDSSSPLPACDAGRTSDAGACTLTH
jgi:hypothetical protein